MNVIFSLNVDSFWILFEENKIVVDLSMLRQCVLAYSLLLLLAKSAFLPRVRQDCSSLFNGRSVYLSTHKIFVGMMR